MPRTKFYYKTLAAVGMMADNCTMRAKNCLWT